MILLIDNYDSFVHNLARYFEQLGQDTMVVRNDAATAESVHALRPQGVVISPGPCTPAEAGCSVDVVRRLGRDVPILGVCLGHQAIAAAWGARIVRANEPMHGRTSRIEHGGVGLFDKLSSPMAVCRYHSLVVDAGSVPRELRVTARMADGTIMGLEHVEYPLYGVQFHPEAALTEYGYHLLANFLRLAGCESAADVPALAANEYRQLAARAYAPPRRPVTF